ncbi:MAG TPA: hypothetical protein VGM10_15835 [Actinocrinis sp.]|jgi:hypothetical protein
MERARLVAASVEVNRVPHGPQRLAAREELLAAAEQSGDPGAVASVLLDLAGDQHHHGGTGAGTAALARAWQIRRTNPEVFDARLHGKLRLVFPAVLEGLVRRRDLPRPEIDRLADEMEGLYRSCGFSLRAVHRSRHLIHRVAGEQEAASARIEAMLSEPGDAHSFCGAFYHYIAALWFERLRDWERAALECRAILAEGASCRCGPSHLANGHNELMYCLLRLGRFEQARVVREAGYPLVRGVERQWRHVMQHILLADLTGDTEYGLRVVRDHAGWLSRGSAKVGECWLLAMIALRFLGRVEAEGGGKRVLVPDEGGGRGLTVARLRADLDAELAELVVKRDAAAGGERFRRLLEKYRHKAGAAREKEKVVVPDGADCGVTADVDAICADD